jgi:flagellar hook-basal body complex protein FliE
MLNPLGTSGPAGSQAVSGVSPVGPARPVSPVAGEGADFGSELAKMLGQQLQKASGLQQEADGKLGALLTGQSQNLGDVFVAAKKAEIAFTLLLEMRNKLVDAYEDLRQMRV